MDAESHILSPTTNETWFALIQRHMRAHPVTALGLAVALAAVIMGRWNPVLAALMALFFGFARALAQTTKLMQLPIPSDFIEMLPYLATIIAVAGLVGRVRSPAADGVHFVKSH